jgi:hypothetical protein
LNYPLVAFKKINQFYAEGIDAEIADNKSKLFKKVKRYTGVLDLLTRLRLIEPSLLSVIILKEIPDDECKKKMRKDGYKWVELPRNPYSS